MNTLEQLRRGELAGATRLVLSEGLTEFPPEILTLADTLEYLDLSGNALTRLPDDFARLHRLEVLFCAGNRFSALPTVLGQCQNLSMLGFRTNQIAHIEAAALPPRLRWLILTGNRLATLPPAIGDCPELQKVVLAGNLLKTLPPEMAKCTKLELLRIGANRFEALPEWLLSMPRLSWLGYSGNPLCAAAETRALADQSALPQIPWSSLQLKEKLGEGASGVIYQAEVARGHPDVAVKVFKGALTSDGLPRSEVAAYLSAGSHPHLINLLGKVIDHPDGTDALVMQLVDSSYQLLAATPSLQSCTRDVYRADRRFSLHDALRIAQGVASLARQLHGRGLIHGDLYAHNTLLGADGHAVLGDFGAAAFYERADQEVAQALEKIEVRAFGCLLQELLERVELEADPTTQRRAAFATARVLRDICLDTQVSKRPQFKDIEEKLSLLARVA